MVLENHHRSEMPEKVKGNTEMQQAVNLSGKNTSMGTQSLGQELSPNSSPSWHIGHGLLSMWPEPLARVCALLPCLPPDQSHRGPFKNTLDSSESGALSHPHEKLKPLHRQQSPA